MTVMEAFVIGSNGRIIQTAESEMLHTSRTDLKAQKRKTYIYPHIDSATHDMHIPAHSERIASANDSKTFPTSIHGIYITALMPMQPIAPSQNVSHPTLPLHNHPPCIPQPPLPNSSSEA